MTSEKDTMTYAAAYRELEQILAALQNDEIDVDGMTLAIKRAKELIRFCQGRLRNLEADLQEVFADDEA